MSHIQTSLYSILEELALQHRTYNDLRADTRFAVWMKHVRNKRSAQAFVKEIFDERLRVQQETIAEVPMYF